MSLLKTNCRGYSNFNCKTPDLHLWIRGDKTHNMSFIAQFITCKVAGQNVFTWNSKIWKCLGTSPTCKGGEAKTKPMATSAIQSEYNFLLRIWTLLHRSMITFGFTLHHWSQSLGNLAKHHWLTTDWHTDMTCMYMLCCVCPELDKAGGRHTYFLWN